MKSKLQLTLICCALFASATRAHAQGADDKTLYELGKDVARLEQEVDGIKSVLAQILELDKQRVALLNQIVSGTVVAPGSMPTAGQPASPSHPPPPAREQTGTISGRVKLPEGAKVAYVYVDNVRGRMVRGRTIDIKQENKQFSPRWAVVQRGTSVRFPNEDSVYHNVFSRSPEAKFDLGIYRRGDDPKSHTFTQPGVVDVYCNMHSAMSAEILIVPNHLYTKVHNDGTFTIANVPEGKRKVVVWTPGYALGDRWVSVEGDGTAEASLAPGAPNKKSHLNKSGQPYGSYK